MDFMTQVTHLLYNTLFSRRVNLKYFREKRFSRIYCSHENIFPRKYHLAKISSREIILLRIVSVPQICKLVGLGYAV